MESEIEHVVVLILENRSFDNMLAWLYEQEAPLQFLPAGSEQKFLGLSEETLNQYSNVLKNSSGETVFSSPPIKGIPSVAGTSYINSPAYNPNEPFPYVMAQMFGNPASQKPTMDGFLQDYASLWSERNWQSEQKMISAVMESYTEDELPILYSLARHYAVSDLWFSSVPTQTNPNRAFAACGTSEGQVVNGTLGKSTFTSDTIWNRLTDLSPQTTWSIFWQTDMAPEIYSGPFTGPNNFTAMARIPELDSHYKKIDQFHALARKGQLPQFSFIEPQMGVSTNIDPDAVPINPDAVMLGVQGNDFHPPGDVRTAENLLANIYTSLISNRQAWSKTLLVITFDEHGGLYDHVPPPTAVPPDSQNGFGFNFDRYGVRVPALFISPRIAKKSVLRSSDPVTPFDHTSLISTIFGWRSVDKALWKMGKRVDQAPSFDSVVTLADAREDAVIYPKDVAPPKSSNPVNFGDHFYLKDHNGNYLVKSSLVSWLAHAGPPDEKVPLTFGAGSGILTHGSFALIRSLDPALGKNNYLETSVINCECLYSANAHDPKQWWTVKSVDRPYIGAPIQYGDKIYLENHIYVDLFQYVPSRLAVDDWYVSNLVTTQPVNVEGCDQLYWILEKAP